MQSGGRTKLLITSLYYGQENGNNFSAGRIVCNLFTNCLMGDFKETAVNQTSFYCK